MRSALHSHRRSGSLTAIASLWLAQGACDSSHTQATSSSGGAAVTSSSGTGGGSPAWANRCHDGMCFIPAGSFTIGSPETEWSRGAFGEEQVNVTLTRSFLLQQYEVTIPEWTDLGWNNPSTPI